MKFARFLLDSKEHVGLVDIERSVIRSLDSSIRDPTQVMAQRAELIPASSNAEGIPLQQVRLLAPVVPRRNIFCVGKNYREHAKEFAGSGYEAGAVKGAEIDEYPAVFSKPPSTIVGTGDDVQLHAHVTDSVDYEAELAIIIGKAGRDIQAEHALEHVWGYTIINDVTARDRQRHHKQWFLGKSLDTFCPMGPWITTADEIKPDELDVKCWVNGELRQDANTKNLIFPIPQLISTISAGLTLEPGDVIATGTPAGVGIGFNPPRFLKAGDEVKISITNLGTLVNRFV